MTGAFGLTAMALRPVTGWAADRWGRRPLMLAGAAVFFLSPFGYWAAASIVALLLVRLFHGCGMGLFPTAASAFVADVAPPARRGELLGLFGTASSVAMALGPWVGVTLLDLYGWSALLATSGVAALGAVGGAWVLRESLREPRAVPFRPSATFSRAAVRPSAVLWFGMLSYGMIVTYLPLHAHGAGLNPGVFFLVYAIAVALLRGAAGGWSDRIGRAPVAAAGLALVALGLAVLGLVDGVVGLALGGFVYGAGHALAQPALMAWCVDRVDATTRGVAMGTYFTSLELGIALGAIAAGPSVAAFGFATTCFALGIMAAGGAVLALALRAARAGPPALDAG